LETLEQRGAFFPIYCRWCHTNDVYHQRVSRYSANARFTADILLHGWTESRLRNYLINFKPGQCRSRGHSKLSQDDPIFAAHQFESHSYIADHELTALACAETFRRCYGEQSIEPRNGTRIDDEDMGLGPFTGYPALLSVWMNTIMRPLYSSSRQYEPLRNFPPGLMVVSVGRMMSRKGSSGLCCGFVIPRNMQLRKIS
jgi:hypothetical protein